MYKLASKSVDFNLPYMILTKTISAAQIGYMRYGLLLTQIFEHFYCDINAHPHFYMNHTISDKIPRVLLSFSEYNVQPASVSIQFGSLPL